MTPEEWQRVRPMLESALELDPSRRSSFLNDACVDASLRLEVESLLASHERAGTDVLKPGLPVGFKFDDEARFRLLPGKRIGAYEIVDEIAVGGMGAVYRAIRADGQYRQQVALKIVRSELGTEFTVARFRKERQILASLDHPNIARILDGGTTADGLPYFVMEIVDGLSITSYCDQHKLSVDARLRIFRTICSAVHYAHQHLVIHRDFKPSNVLVTAEGIPKLLDFGIAKILDADLLSETPTMTAAGLSMMTPEYASPEQFRGEPITTASDVYSLGLVLYELLTGQHAYRFQSRMPHDVARVVLETEPEIPSSAVRREIVQQLQNSKTALTPELISSLRMESPGSLRRRLAGDLDNIVLKAIRKEPRSRYTSAEQLSEDIRRHLEGLPVLVRKSTFAYRCRKYILRHQAAAMVGVLVFLLSLSGVVLVVREARIARANQLQAERRFNDVRALANSLIFDLHDSIQDLPGATPARKLIVEKALQYLDGLAGESQGDPSLQRELAAAYKRIGDVQGYDFNANLGDSSAALNSYKKSLAIRKALWLSEGGDVENALALAEALRLVSHQMQTSGNELSVALENAQKAVELVEPLRKSHPNDTAVLLEFIVDCQAVANILSDVGLIHLGQNATAIAFRRKQLDGAEQLASLDPGSDRGKGNLAIAITSMGEQLWQGGERTVPMQQYSRAQAMFAELAEHSQRKRARALYLLNEVYLGIADAEVANGELEKALATIRVALRSTRTLSEADPSDAQSGLEVANDYVSLADLESKSGRTQAASTDMNKATILMTRFVGPNSKDATKLDSLTGLYLTRGALASRSGDYVGALKSYEAAIATFSELQSADANNVGARDHLAATYNIVGRVQLKQKNFEEATVSFNRARALSNVEFAVANANAQELYTIADANTGLGDVEAALGADPRQGRKTRVEHWKRAVSWYENSLMTWREIKEPGRSSPDMFDAVPPSIVAERLARANKALSAIKAMAEREGF